MKFIFRGYLVFEYEPHYKRVIQHSIESTQTPAYDFCDFIPEDYKLISEFFDRAYRHIKGEQVDLSDIEVY